MNERVREIARDRYSIAGIGALFEYVKACPSFQEWSSKPHAFCFYGVNQYSRNVQLIAIRDALRAIDIPFHIVYRGDAQGLTDAFGHPNLVVLVDALLLPEIEPFVAKTGCKIVLLWRYYDETPNPVLAPKVSEGEKEILKKFRKYIALVISELSSEGNRELLYGYYRDFGLPVMTFPWAADIERHTPHECRIDKDIFFIGTYYEKAQRIVDYFGRALRKYTHTVIGPDWQTSPFRWLANSLMDVNTFNDRAPALYSSHAVSLNLHHQFETNGYSCNERIFNAIACGGFLISDNARRIRDLFEEDELVTAGNPDEYYDKISYFIENPDARTPFMEKAARKVYAHHTYHHRIADLLAAMFTGKPQTPFCPLMITEHQEVE